MESFYHKEHMETAVAKALADREGQMKDFFHVISVFFVVFKFISLSSSGGCAGMLPVTKIILNNCKIIVVLMNHYAIV